MTPNATNPTSEVAIAIGQSAQRPAPLAGRAQSVRRPCRRNLGCRSDDRLDIMAEDRLDGPGDQLQVPFDREREGIEPVRVAQGIVHRSFGTNVLDPDRQDDHAPADRPFDFATDVPEALVWPEKTNTMILLWLIPLMIAAPSSSPGAMSLGAIQHRTR